MMNLDFDVKLILGFTVPVLLLGSLFDVTAVSYIAIFLYLFIPGLALRYLLCVVLPRPKSFTYTVVESLFLSLCWIFVFGTFSILSGVQFAGVGLTIVLLCCALLLGPVHRIEYGPVRAADGLVLVTTLAVVFFVSFPHLLSTQATISFHGLFHSSIVYNLLNGQIPPHNPMYAWESIRTYWPFHHIVASLSYWTEENPLRIMFLMNLFAIVTVIVLVRGIFKTLYQDIATYKIVPVAVLVSLFGMHHTGPLFLFAEGPAQFEAFVQGEFSYSVVRELSPVASRATTFLDKFMNQSGFPFGVLLFVSALHLFGRAQDGEYEHVVWVFGTFAGTMVFLFHIHTVTALFTFSGLGVATIPVVYQYKQRQIRWTQLRRWSLTWLAVAVGCFPFYYHLSTVGTYDGTLAFQVSFQTVLQAELAFLLLLPFAYLEGKTLLRNQSAYGRTIVILLVMLILVPLFLKLPDGNGYKSLFLLSVPFGILTGGALNRLSFRWSRATNVVIPVLLVLLMVNPLLFLTAGHHLDRYSGESEYSLEEQSIELQSGNEANDLAVWFQSETPRDSGIVFSPNASSQFDGIREPLSLSAVTQRNVYYVLKYETYISYSDMRDRATLTHRLQSCDVDREIAAQSALYMVVTTDERHSSIDGDTTCSPVTVFSESRNWTRETRDGSLVVFRYTGPQSAV